VTTADPTDFADDDVDSPSAFAALLRSPSLRLAGRRLLMAVPIVLGVSILTFLVLNLIPGNAAQLILGPAARPAQIAALDHQMGLDQPEITRYLNWLAGALHGDLGHSAVSGQSVAGEIGSRLGVSFELVGLAFVVSLVASIPVALLAARKPNRLLDRVSMFVSISGLSIANYVFALLLVLVFAVQLSLFPAIGFVPPSAGVLANLRSLTLPVLALAFPLFCFYTRFLRGDLIEQLREEDYILTAKAKGIGPWQVLLRHAFRNSSFGLLTVVGLNLGTLIGSTVIIEQIFSLPGIGQLLLQAINTRDYTVVQAVVVVFAIVAVLANLLTDLLYAVLDPRIRYGNG
jgi:peptide/nickel transport system permease protein